MSATQPSRSGGPDRGGWYQADLHPDGSAGGNNRSPGSPPLQTCSGGGNLPRAGLERVGRGHHNACGIVGTTDQPDMRWLLTNGRGGPSAQNGGSRVGGPPYPLRQVTGYHDRVVPVLCPPTDVHWADGRHRMGHYRDCLVLRSFAARSRISVRVSPRTGGRSSTSSQHGGLSRWTSGWGSAPSSR